MQSAGTNHRMARSIPTRTVAVLISEYAPLLWKARCCPSCMACRRSLAMCRSRDHRRGAEYRAEVYGVCAFYRFPQAPGRPARAELCQAEACRSMGSDASGSQDHAEARHRLSPKPPTAR